MKRTKWTPWICVALMLISGAVFAADSKISQLNELTAPDDADEYVVVDTTATETKRMTWANLKAAIKSYYDSVTATLTDKTLTSPDINGGTIDDAVIGGTTPAAGTFTSVSTDTLTVTTAIEAPTAGIVDTVQVADINISTSDTLAIGPFNFVPSQIVLNWTGRAARDTTLEYGQTSGVCVVTITDTDTITSAMHYSSGIDNNGTFAGLASSALDTSDAVRIDGGSNGGSSSVTASAAWVTATKTLTLTFTTSNTEDGYSRIGITAIAYR